MKPLICKWQRFDMRGAWRPHWNPLWGFYALLMIIFLGFLQLPGAAAGTPAPAPERAYVEPWTYEVPAVLDLATPTSRLTALPQTTGGGHSTTLTWILSTDDTATACTTTANCLQNVYRASGACTNTFSLLTTTALSAAAAQYIDSTVTPGVWCYGVTFSINGLESAKDTASVTLQPASPTGAAATSK